MATSKKIVPATASTATTRRMTKSPAKAITVKASQDVSNESDTAALAALRKEVDVLRTSFADAQKRATASVKSGATWVDTKAHEGLGAHPWAKMAGAAAITVAVTKLVRFLPFGGIAAVAAPLVIQKLGEGKRGGKKWLSAS